MKETKRSLVAILTISDRCTAGIRKDEGGPCLEGWVRTLGWEIECKKIVPDDFKTIVDTLKKWCRDDKLDIILTTGGTGIGPRDVTPEATAHILDKELPGISEELRRQGVSHTPFAMLSRAKAGIRGNTLIINLPGNPKSLQESFPVLEKVIPHALEMIAGKNHVL